MRAYSRARRDVYKRAKRGVSTAHSAPYTRQLRCTYTSAAPCIRQLQCTYTRIIPWIDTSIIRLYCINNKVAIVDTSLRRPCVAQQPSTRESSFTAVYVHLLFRDSPLSSPLLRNCVRKLFQSQRPYVFVFLVAYNCVTYTWRLFLCTQYVSTSHVCGVCTPE